MSHECSFKENILILMRAKIFQSGETDETDFNSL